MVASEVLLSPSIYWHFAHEEVEKMVRARADGCWCFVLRPFEANRKVYLKETT